ncbi:MAG: 2,3-bisphosphoglycerate-independent phosphoglycerate mutase, partial [bacterium]|nr:2,3-bisphosphoglycerate-independent phosphoglycerate mutase [bacterium]
LCKIASLCGRFYAMDRDKRWERTKLAWDAIVESTSNKITDPLVYLEECYSKGISDEFIDPVVVDGSVINKDDGLLFWNFRTDRMKQIVAAMTQENFTEFDRKGHIHSKERSLCLTEYDPNFQIPFLFEAIEIPNHLGEVISNLGLKQLRTAETEKYPHVTYFLNGLFEGHLVGEDRKVIPSPRDIKTYDLKPEMSAFGVRDVVLEAIKSGKHDLIIVNFANCDMVGHTGILKAAIKAVETVDQCLGEILSELSKVSGQALIIADHGNAEQMVNYETGEPHTSHTTYPVPAILFGANKKITKLRDGGALCDVAPTILKMMELSQPKEMTGKSLF